VGIGLSKTGRELLDRYELFIFDWDGTLCSLRYIQKIADLLKSRVIRRIFGTKANVRMKEEKLRQHTKIHDLRQESEEKRLTHSLLSTCVDIALSISKPRLKNGALETLKKLKREGKEIALLTNGSDWRIIKEIRREKIEDYFDVIISARNMGAIKPDPLGLNGIVSILEVDKKRVLYIGDMEDDILTAEYAHVDSCGISDGFASYSDLKENRPDYLFRSMEEFAKRL
jgi:HAD superfamily hydrolase (TIGR01549 family)